MNEHDLTRLQERLLNDEDYAQVMRDFLDGVGKDSGFLERGEAFEDPFLIHLATAAAHQVLGLKSQMQTAALYRLNEPAFVHGSVFIDNQFAVLIYFPPHGIGVMAAMMPGRNAPETHFIKLTARLVPEPAAGFRNN